MKSFTHIFYIENQRAILGLQPPIQDDRGAYRTGRIELDNGRKMPIICRHSSSTAALTYLHPLEITDDWRRLLGLPTFTHPQTIEAPGALQVGVNRARLLSQGILDLLDTPDLTDTLKKALDEKIVLLPVFREGKQFGLANNLKNICNHTCSEELIENAPNAAQQQFHTPQNVLTGAQRERVQLAVIGTGLTGGKQLVRLINYVQNRFPNLSKIELILPQATLQGLTQTLSHTSPGLSLRSHTFETLFNDKNEQGCFFPHPEFHIRPNLSRAYRGWWGRDPKGHPIANMPHIGTDGADALFDPVRQIRTLNQRLQQMHNTSLAHVIARHLTQSVEHIS